MTNFILDWVLAMLSIFNDNCPMIKAVRLDNLGNLFKHFEKHSLCPNWGIWMVYSSGISFTEGHAKDGKCARN